jgi:hypothetical protein
MPEEIGLTSGLPRVVAGAASSITPLNHFGHEKTYLRIGICEAGMSDESVLRKWAAQAAQQASAEKNPDEARRLMSFARHWTRLADAEDWKRAQAAA